MSCPFCPPLERPLVAENELAVAFGDKYPVGDGHTLVIPRRHVESWFDATAAERAAMIALADEVKRALDAQLAPSGYNLGVNIGRAAGQTVMHLHLHLIPRFAGDVEDPTGGVRHVIPGKGRYGEMG
jgi:diadenosine tetraphosphate (Ap4A) HIT family hydrolase